jgi:chromate transporter
MGGFRDPGELDPVIAGVFAGLLTTWVTFAPCFLWIFLGAPYIERLRNNGAAASALKGVSAAVVGVIANLAVWFALQVLFGTVDETQIGPLAIWRPDLSSIQPAALAIALLSGALLWRHTNVLIVLGNAAILGIAALLFGLA